MGNDRLPFLADLGISWGLVMVSLVVAVPVISSRIKDDLVADNTSNGDQSEELLPPRRII